MAVISDLGLVIKKTELNLLELILNLKKEGTKLPMKNYSLKYVATRHVWITPRSILYGLGVLAAFCLIKKQNWFETNQFVPTGF